MAIIRPHTPTRAERREEAESGAFQTHSAYVQAFSLLAGYRDADHDDAPGLNRALSMIRASPSLQVPTVRIVPDDVYPMLVSAWGTELLLALNETYLKEDDIVRVSNNWCVVQLYYVMYHATQALVVARGNRRPVSHAATQRIFMDYWVKKQLQIPPWTFGIGSSGYRNVSQGRVITDIHPWSACDTNTCWDIAGKALKTTRGEGFREHIKHRREDKQKVTRKAWNEQEQQRLAAGRIARKKPDFGLPLLTPEEKDAAKASLRDYTFMDYVYRLRINANYEDGSMFIDGPRDRLSSERLRHNLIRLASSTLLLNEAHVLVALGKENMMQLVDRWLTSGQANTPNVGVALRADILRAF